MTKPKVGKQFSFTTKKHIRKETTEDAITTDIVMTRAEALRLIAAVTNTLICDADTDTVRIVGYDMKNDTSHCTVHPR